MKLKCQADDCNSSFHLECLNLRDDNYDDLKNELVVRKWNLDDVIYHCMDHHCKPGEISTSIYPTKDNDTPAAHWVKNKTTTSWTIGLNYSKCAAGRDCIPFCYPKETKSKKTKN